MKLETVLGSKNRVRVLRALLSRDSVCGRELARLARLSPSAANVAVTELVDAGVIFRSGSAGKHLFEVNSDHYLMDHLSRLFEAERSLLSKMTGLVRRHVNDMVPRPDLWGISVDDAGVTVVVTPLPSPNEPTLRGLSIALKAEFGVVLAGVSSDPSLLDTPNGMRLAHPEKHSEHSRTRTRERMLDFFGLPADGAGQKER